MNEAPQPLDAQPLIDALTRQRNEQMDRVAHAEAALFTTQQALQTALASSAKVQSMLDDTLVAMKQQQDLNELNKDEQERATAGLREQMKNLEDQLAAYQAVPPTAPSGLVVPPLGALPEANAITA